MAIVLTYRSTNNRAYCLEIYNDKHIDNEGLVQLDEMRIAAITHHTQTAVDSSPIDACLAPALETSKSKSATF
jgi:hypothetical protein